MKIEDKLTESQASEILKNKIVFISDVGWHGITVVVDGVEYELETWWRSSDE